MGKPKSNTQLKPASLSEARRMGALVGVAPFVKRKSYIGGTPKQARQTYWDTDNEMYLLTDSVARSYNIAPELLRARMDAEGYTDARIKAINEDVKNNTNRALLGENLFRSPAMPYVAGEEFGLDDVATYINDGKVQLINENWGDGQFLNEKGRWTNMAMGHNYSDNIGIMAATLKGMRDQAKKDFPNASESDLDRYAQAYYNRGFTGGKKYAQNKGKGYKVRRTLETGGLVESYENFKREHPVITEAATYLPIVGTAMDAYEAYKNPTASNIANAVISLGADVLGYRLLKNAGKAYKTLKAAKKAKADDLIRRNFSKEYAKQATEMNFYGDDEYARYVTTILGTQGGDKIINLFQNKLEKERQEKKDGGSIHIAPSKRGTFTAAATKHGMGVQAFASKVLANKDNYSPAMVKKANFARNASKWNH